MEKTLLSRQSPMLLGTLAESRDFLPLLRWLIIVSLTGFGAIVLWRLGLISIMLETDRTHISSLILALFVLTSLHCLVQTWFVSSEITQVRSFGEMLRREHSFLATFPSDPNSVPQDSIVARHVANLVAKARAQKGRRPGPRLCGRRAMAATDLSSNRMGRRAGPRDGTSPGRA